MGSLEQINSRIAVLNSTSQRVNNERQVNIGKKETLKKQLDDAIKLYQEKYGVALSVDTLFNMSISTFYCVIK